MDQSRYLIEYEAYAMDVWYPYNGTVSLHLAYLYTTTERDVHGNWVMCPWMARDSADTLHIALRTKYDI